MQTLTRKTGIGLVALFVAGMAMVLASTMSSRGADDDKGIVSSFLSRMLTTPTARVSIGSVQGALLSDSTINDITIADRDGVWLQIDRVRFNWRRSALLFRRLEIDTLQIGRINVLRRPLPTEQAATATVSDEPLLPELPLKLIVKEFTLGELALGETVIGTAARLSATGNATLGNPAEGLNLRFEARRLDAQGSLTARLDLVPQTQRLDVQLGVDEPARGVVAHALNIPGLPPVKLDLNGTGTLDAFDARLAFDAGESIGASGAAQLRRQADTRRLSLNMAARIEGLLPTLAAPIFAGTTQLNGDIAFADSGAVTIAPLSVVSQTARLDISGSLSSEQVADLKISARAVPNAGDKTAAAGTEIRQLVFDATVAGPITGPRIDASLDAQDIATPLGRAGRVSGKFNVAPSGDVMEKTTSIPFSANLQATGLAAADPALARALGSSVTLTVAGSAVDGVADVQTARVQTPTSDLRFAGRIGGTVLQGKLTADVPDLARFGGLADLRLAGAANVTADLTGVPNNGLFEATLTGQANRFATGIAPVDGLVDGRLTLSGRVSKLPDGGFGFGDLRLNGAHVSARVDGQATQAQANIDANVTIPDLRRADNQLAGRAEIVSRITGTVERPDGTATVTVTNGRALGRPVPRLVLGLSATDLLGLIDARVRLDGTIDGKPAQGGLRAAKQPDGGWQVNDIDLRVGSVTAQGGVTLTAANLAEGRIAINAGNLDDLSPLVLTRLSGRLQADATLAIVDGGQNGTLTANTLNVKAGPSSLDRLDANVRVTDLYRRPVIDGTVAVDRAVIAGEQISQVRLTSRGAAGASDITLTAQARGFALDTRGRLIAGDNIRLELATLTAQRDKRRVALTQPATLTLRDDGVDIPALTLALDRGRLSVNGRAGSTLDLAVTAQAVPLSIVDVFVPNFGLSGTLDADAKITGTSQAPTGNWRLRVDNLVAPQTRDAGLPPLNINGTGRLADGRSTVDATIAAAGAGTIRITGAVPFQGDGLDVRARGQINLGVANRGLSAAGRSVTGRADLDVQVVGSLTNPRANGAATIAGGSYTDILAGLRYTGISGRITAQGTDIRIERLSAQTPNGGTINVLGNVGIDPQAGFPGNIRITGQRARIIENDIFTAVANLSLTLSGPLARDPRIAGRIDMVSIDVTVPENLPTTLKPIEGTVHVAPPPEARARLAAQARARARAGSAPPFDAMLDLTISAPNRVFVRGRGIDAELGGDLQLRGRLSDPQTIGAFELRRGRISIAGNTLDFTQGRIVFTGDMTPEVDFIAQTRAADVTAFITVNGPARQPSFGFRSEPDLPQDEVLSRILFSRASGGLSAIQALQLAQVAAQFSGGGGPDVFERVRRSLGVDSLDVSVGAGGNPTVGVRRAINRRISIGVKSGADAADSGVSVDVDVTRNIRLKGEADANGGTAVGVGVEWEY